MTKSESSSSVEELRATAMQQLSEYDPDSDIFMLVITKNGKNYYQQEQHVIGECRLTTTVMHIVGLVRYLANSLKEHPYTFIARHILAPFIVQERDQLELSKPISPTSRLETIKNYGILDESDVKDPN